MSIIIEKLSYTYSKKTPFEFNALKDVNLEIKHGEFFGIIGHTGSGKSTLISHLNALIKMQQGKLEVAGFDLSQKKIDFKALRKNVGMVFQYPEYQLFAETVYKDVEFGLKNFYGKTNKKEKDDSILREQFEKRIKDAIELVGLNYNEVKGKSPFELSGGQKRRAAIAGVIVTKPQILVLDEPTAGLDPMGKKDIMSMLKTLQKHTIPTIIIISHDMDEVGENCDRVAIFNKGKVIACETPRKLFANHELLEYVGLDLPIISKMSLELYNRGYEIEKICLTEKELYKGILKLYKERDNQ